MASQMSSFEALTKAFDLMKKAVPSPEGLMEDEDMIFMANFLVQYSIALSLYDIARK